MKRFLFIVPFIIWAVWMWINVAEVESASIRIGFVIAFVLSLFFRIVEQKMRTLAEMKRLLFTVPFITWVVWVNVMEVKNTSIMVGFLIALALSLFLKIMEQKNGALAKKKLC